MLEAVFENDNGKRYVFGPSGNTWFGMDLGSGMSVSIGTSQGFSQVGETVDTMTVTGRTINVSGEIFGNIPQIKDRLRNVCAPFSSGRLIFNKSHFVRVYVKSAPTFSAVRENGLFKMQFYAPYPFYLNLQERVFSVGSVIPQFSFPVNYSQPHTFGVRQKERYVNVLNDGDVRVPYRLRLASSGTCTNITITNMKTFAFLRLKGVLEAGEVIDIYRDTENVLRAELTSDGSTKDILSWIDEESSLFELAVGDNLLSVDDDEGGVSLTAQFSFHAAAAALYET